VLSWARQRVRDDSGLEKLLHEAALVSLGVVGCSAALRFFFPAFFRDSNASDVLCTSFSIVLMLCVVRLLPPTQAVEMSELALLVAEGVWEDLLQDTAETIACLDPGEQRQRQPAGPCAHLGCACIGLGSFWDFQH
jgi:hypothetical protein